VWLDCNHYCTDVDLASKGNEVCMCVCVCVCVNHCTFTMTRTCCSSQY